MIKIFMFLALKKSMCFPINGLYGRWSILDGKSHLVINEKEVVCHKGKSQLVMTPKLISEGKLLKIHLHSLNIRAYPDKLDVNALTALKWIHKIKKYGIDTEIDLNDTTARVSWRIKDTIGDCDLTKIK